MLAYGGYAACLDLFSEHHAKDRRLGRVLDVSLEQVGGGILGVDGDMQLVIKSRLADGENNGLLIGLGDFVDAAAGQGIVKLTGQRVHGKAVKTHGGFLSAKKYL